MKKCVADSWSAITKVYGDGTITPEVQAIIDAEIKKISDAKAEEDKQTLAQLEEYKKKFTGEAAEKQRLDEQITILKTRTKTMEAQAAEEANRIKAEFSEKLTQTEADRDQWRSKFEQTYVSNEIMTAATTHKAVNPNQLMAMLRPSTKLVPDFDDKNKPTGTFTSMTRVIIGDKELDLPTSKAIEEMRKHDSYFNLFSDTMKGGLGGSQNVGQVDINALAKDAKAYREAKKNGTIK